MSPLLLIPGGMCRPTAWRLQIEPLARRRPLILANSYQHHTSIEAMARDILANAPSTFDLIAWSMGGYIAFEILRIAADRVARLVLVSTSAAPDGEEARERRMGDLAEARSSGLAPLCRRSYQQGVRDLARVPPDLLDALLADYLELGLETLESQTRAIIKRRDSRPMLGSISQPALVVGGAHDVAFPPAQMTALAEQLGRGSLRILENAAHCVPIECPEQFNAMVGDFLR